MLQALHAKAVDDRKKLDQSFAQTAQAAPGAAGAQPPNPHAITAEDSKKIYDPVQFKKRVETYETKFSTRRIFPVKQLLGADETLIRMEKEKQNSMYSPIGLGEILAARLYTSYGQMNQNSTSIQKNDKAFAVSVSDRKDGQVTIFGQTKTNFTPNSSQLIQDGAVAAGWAMKLFELADEPHIDGFIQWFCDLTRKYPNKLWAVKEIWDTITWNIALAMRAGTPFHQVAEDQMKDTDLRHEIMMKSPPKEDPPDRRTPRSQEFKDKKGGRGGKGGKTDQKKGGKGGRGGGKGRGGKGGGQGGGQGGRGQAKRGRRQDYDEYDYDYDDQSYNDQQWGKWTKNNNKKWSNNGWGKKGRKDH